MMNRVMATFVMAFVLMVGTAGIALSADLKPIHTRTVKDMVITVSNESGHWTQGKNEFVLEFISAKTHQPVDVGKVSLSTSMTMPGMAPMLAGATLAPDRTPGRYTGAISFPDRGARQVMVMWEGPAGKGSTKFSVPVR